MKEWLIKKLGGFTPKEYKSEKERNKRLLFRKGDLVFVNRKDFNPKTRYTLLEPYKGKTCWYVSTEPESKLRRELENGVHIDQISFEEIEVCPCCNQVVV